MVTKILSVSTWGLPEVGRKMLEWITNSATSYKKVDIQNQTMYQTLWSVWGYLVNNYKYIETIASIDHNDTELG